MTGQLTGFSVKFIRKFTKRLPIISRYVFLSKLLMLANRFNYFEMHIFSPSLFSLSIYLFFSIEETLIRFVGVLRHFMKSLSTIYFQLYHLILRIPADANKSGWVFVLCCAIGQQTAPKLNLSTHRARVRERESERDNMLRRIHITTREILTKALRNQHSGKWKLTEKNWWWCKNESEKLIPFSFGILKENHLRIKTHNWWMIRLKADGLPHRSFYIAVIIHHRLDSRQFHTSCLKRYTREHIYKNWLIHTHKSWYE